METISKHIGEGFGKGELYAALAYDSSDAFGGLAVKQMRFNPVSGATAIAIGVSGTEIALTVAAQRAISIHTTSALAAGAIKSVEIAQIHTGASTANNIEVLKVQLTSDVKTGTWVNAIFGRINYTANGYAYGSGSAICGELSMPAGGPGQGTYSVFQAEIDIPLGATAIGHETSVMDINIWGDKKDLFDDHGYFFTITGITAGSTHFWYNNTLKCKILGTNWYLPFSSAQGSFTTAYPIVSTQTAAAAIQLGTTGKIQFRAVANYISSSGANTLDIVSPTINLTATSGIVLTGTSTGNQIEITGAWGSGLTYAGISIGDYSTAYALNSGTTTTGHYLGEVIHLSADIGAGFNVIPLLIKFITTGDAGAAAVVQNIYSDVNVDHELSDAYGIRTKIGISPASGETLNLMLGIYSQLIVDTSDIVISSEMAAGLFDVDVSKNVTTGKVHGININMNGVTYDTTSIVDGLYVGCEAACYVDYGINIACATNNLTATQFINITQGAGSCTVAKGLLIDVYTEASQKFTHGIYFGNNACTTSIFFGTPATAMMNFVDDGTIASVTNGSILNDISATTNAGFIKVTFDDSTVRYVAVYEAKS